MYATDISISGRSRAKQKDCMQQVITLGLLENPSAILILVYYTGARGIFLFECTGLREVQHGTYMDYGRLPAFNAS